MSSFQISWSLVSTRTENVWPQITMWAPSTHPNMSFHPVKTLTWKMLHVIDGGSCRAATSANIYNSWQLLLHMNSSWILLYEEEVRREVMEAWEVWVKALWGHEGGQVYMQGGAVVMQRCVGALLARLNPHVPLLIPSGGSDERKKKENDEEERTDAETPGERLALTAQQRRIMPGALSSSTNSKVMYGFNCAKGGST